MNKRLPFRFCKASELRVTGETWLKYWVVVWKSVAHLQVGLLTWDQVSLGWMYSIFPWPHSTILLPPEFSARMFFSHQVHLGRSSGSETEVIPWAEGTNGSVKQSNSRFWDWCWFYFVLNCCFLVSIRGQSNGQDHFPFAQYMCRQGRRKCICIWKCDTFPNHKFILVPLMFWCFTCK